MKKRVIRTFSCLLIAVLALTCLCSCSTKKALCGVWEFYEYDPEDYSSARPFRWLEFYSDGTYSSDEANYNGGFSIDGNRMKLDGILMPPMTLNFEVHGNTLVIDDHYVYKKLNI